MSELIHEAESNLEEPAIPKLEHPKSISIGSEHESSPKPEKGKEL